MLEKRNMRKEGIDIMEQQERNFQSLMPAKPYHIKGHLQTPSAIQHLIAPMEYLKEASSINKIKFEPHCECCFTAIIDLTSREGKNNLKQNCKGNKGQQYNSSFDLRLPLSHSSHFNSLAFVLG